MNEEIKEILEQLRDVAKKNYFIVEDGNVTQGHFEPSRPATMYINNFTANLLLDYITNLQSNWNSLRKWLEEQKENKKYDNDFERFTAYDSAIDKMNKLEGGKK